MTTDSVIFQYPPPLHCWHYGLPTSTIVPPQSVCRNIKIQQILWAMNPIQSFAQSLVETCPIQGLWRESLLHSDHFLPVYFISVPCVLRLWDALKKEASDFGHINIDE